MGVVSVNGCRDWGPRVTTEVRGSCGWTFPFCIQIDSSEIIF